VKSCTLFLHAPSVSMGDRRLRNRGPLFLIEVLQLGLSMGFPLCFEEVGYEEWGQPSGWSDRRIGSRYSWCVPDAVGKSSTENDLPLSVM
jgi:hypothetical protein